jgi:gamma-glutamyltranspeptidase/glutathione hydrolase
MRFFVAWLLCVITVSQSLAQSRKGVVVAAEPQAAEAGLQMLRAGGNCVDAAVATAFALAVTWPAAGNLGGGGFLVARLGDGRTLALDFRELAPLAATRGMFLDADGNPVPGRSTIGVLAAGTPGSVPGLCHALERMGKLKLPVVLAPAIRLAREGFCVGPHGARSINGSRKLLERCPESRRIFLANATETHENFHLTQPELAATLTRLAEHGLEDWQKGRTAELLLACMREQQGLIQASDLADYRAVEREPLRGRYRGHDILAMPPPSSGGIALLQMLGILEARQLHEVGWTSVQGRHLIIESMRRAFADRARFLGDPDQSSIPVKELLAQERIAAMAASIQESAVPLEDAALPEPEHDETTHLSVMDGEGGAASLTTTLNGSFGCGVTVKGAGFLLNNEMDDFASAPGRANMYGLIQGEANSIAPRRRPLSSMTPTILCRDNEAVFVTGSPGGPTIISTVLLSILARVDGGLSAQDVVKARRFHHQWRPDALSFESGAFSAAVRGELELRGHRFAQKPRSQGDCHVIVRNPKTGVLTGAADPRGGGAARGF